MENEEIKKHIMDQFLIDFKFQFNLDPTSNKIKKVILEALTILKKEHEEGIPHGGLGIVIGNFYPEAKGFGILGKKGNPIEQKLRYIPIDIYSDVDNKHLAATEGELKLLHKSYEAKFNDFVEFLRRASKRDGFVLIDKSRQILATRAYAVSPIPNFEVLGNTRHLSMDYICRESPQVLFGIVLSEEKNKITIFENGHAEEYNLELKD